MEMVRRALQDELIDKQIPTRLAKLLLREDIEKKVEANPLLRSVITELLKGGDHLVGTDAFGRPSGKEVRAPIEVLEQLRSEGLLHRQGRGNDATYLPKGFARLAIDL
jgi:hypothetical protein